MSGRRYTQAQVDAMLKVLMEVGYAGLSDEEKAIADWLDAPGWLGSKVQTKLYRSALAQARRLNKGYSDAELQEEVEDILHDWAREAAEDAELRGDTEHLENGVHNCDDFGTGEGRYHGRI